MSDPKPDTTPASRFCVYDLTLEQFVGPVLHKSPAKDDVEALMRSLGRAKHKHEVRPV